MCRFLPRAATPPHLRRPSARAAALLALPLAACAARRGGDAGAPAPALGPPAAPPAGLRLESAALTLEVDARPYRYRLRERATGRLLVEKSGPTALRTGGTERPVVEARAAAGPAGALALDLLLAPGEPPIRARLSFPETSRLLVEYEATPASGPIELGEAFADAGEHSYGVWEYPFGGAIDNRGADRPFTGFGSLPEVKYPNARAPFYVTSRGYGVYVDSRAAGRFAFAKEGQTRFAFAGARLRYHVLHGPRYADVFARYNALAGPAAMPPLWAFGTVFWRDDHHSDTRGVKNAQENVIRDADELRRRRIPASVMLIDRPYGTGEHGWGNMDFDPGFPDPRKMVADLDVRGMKPMLWIANRAANRLKAEGEARGFLHAEERPVEPGWPAIDLARPGAAAWLQEKLEPLLALGVQSFKLDRGEEGEMPAAAVNENAILFPRTIAEATRRAATRARGNGEIFLIARNVNDVGRRDTAVWSGDPQATFAGLAVSIKNALRAGAMNFPVWGSDTGGYLGRPTKELYARWLAFSAYSPLMEILIEHQGRSLWADYDDELLALVRRFSEEHHDLIPYVRSAVHQATRTGAPVMRALVFEFPEDPALVDLWDAYLYGDALLVAPIVEAGATERAVYLPAGRWVDARDGLTVHEGGRRVTVKAPLDSIPVFAREGAIVPRGAILQANDGWTPGWKPTLRVQIYPARRAPSRFAYFTGAGVAKIVAEPVAEPAADGLRVSIEDLGAGGTLEIHARGVTRVLRDGRPLPAGSYQVDAQAAVVRIPFERGAARFDLPGARSLF